MAEVNLRIDGMHCGTCLRRVTQSLQAVPCAQVAEVRLGAARVGVSEEAGIDRLIAGLGKAGFFAQVEK